MVHLLIISNLRVVTCTFCLMRKRLNLSLAPDTYATLERMSSSGGFRSVHDMVKTLLRVVASSVATETAGSGEVDDSGFIRSMFEEASDHCATPFNTVPPRRRRRRDG